MLGSLCEDHTDRMLRKAGLFGSNGWRIGYSQSGKVLRYCGPGRMLVVAGARKGKFVSVLGPAALQHCVASRIFVDPKGELLAVTYKQASRFSEVVVLGMELPLGFTALIQTAVHPSIEWDAGPSFPEDDGNSRFAH